MIRQLSLTLILLLATISCSWAFVSSSSRRIRHQSVNLQPSIFRHGFLLSATLETAPVETKVGSNLKKIGNAVILLPSQGADEILSPFGGKSPVGRTAVGTVAQQLARKTTHFSVDTIDTEIVMVPTEVDDSYDQVMHKLQHKVNVIIALGLQSASDLAFAEKLFDKRRNNDPSIRGRQAHFTLNCAKRLTPLVGPYDEERFNLLALFPWTKSASAKRLQEQMEGLFDRWTSDDYGVAMMLFFNFAVAEVDWVKHRYLLCCVISSNIFWHSFRPLTIVSFHECLASMQHGRKDHCAMHRNWQLWSTSVAIVSSSVCRMKNAKNA